MPGISMFYVWIIMMYYFDNRQHHTPHIHVKFGEFEAVYGIYEGNLLEGELPRTKHKLVMAWIEIHKEELIANWELAVNGTEIFRIEPLK